MSPSPSGTDLLAVRVMHEQEWAYDLRAQHLSMRDISRRTIATRDEGGLGYYLSPHQIKGLVNGYVERMRETLEESPAERVAQELADLDMQYRAAAALCVPTYEHENSDGEIVTVRRDERVIIAALAQLRAIGERRAKLLGLDAVVTTKVDVTVSDATDRQIADLAEQLDLRAKS